MCDFNIVKNTANTYIISIYKFRDLFDFLCFDLLSLSN